MFGKKFNKYVLFSIDVVFIYRIETGRYVGLERDERLCKKCNTLMVEDEYHFFINLPSLYNDIRMKYFSRYFCHWPNMSKFKSLMSSKSQYTLSNLSKYT